MQTILYIVMFLIGYISYPIIHFDKNEYYKKQIEKSIKKEDKK